MKKNLLVAMLLIIGLNGKSQVNQLHDYMNDLTIDSSYVIFANASVATADGGYVVATNSQYHGDISLSTYGISLVKYDDQGNKVWNNFIYGFDNQSITVKRLLELTDGSLIVFGVAPLTFIIKTNSTGNILFSKSYTTIGYNISLDPTDNGFIISGVTGFQPGNMGCNIVKTDATGNVVWGKRLNFTTNNDFYYASKKLSDGGYLSAGTTITTPSAVTSDALLSRFDADGNLMWSYTYNYPAVTTYAMSAFIDFKELPDGGLLVTGAIGTFVPTQPVYQSEPLVTRLDKNGNVIWAKYYGTGNDIFFDFNTFQSNFSRVDYTGSYLYIGDNINTITATGNTGLLKIDTSGNLLWTKRFKQVPLTGVGLGNVLSLSVRGSNLSFNSYNAIFTMDTSVVSATCYISDTLLNTTTVTPTKIAANTIAVDTVTTKVAVLPLTASNAVNFVKHDACTTTNNVLKIRTTAVVSLFPNPTSGIISIAVSGTNDDSQLILFDMMGKKIYQSAINNSRLSIDLGVYPKGIYLCHITSHGNIVSAKNIIVD